MKLSNLIPTLPLILALVTLPLAGCKDGPTPEQKTACEEFAKHLAEVVQTQQGEQVPQAQVDKMLEATVDKCLEKPPKADAMKCAMAAQDLETMKACDPAPEQPAQ